MVHEEKIATSVARGTATTRWRDLADVIELADPALTHEVAGLTWDPIARAWASPPGLNPAGGCAKWSCCQSGVVR